MVGFKVWPDKRCLRGLHWVYALDRCIDFAELERALLDAFDQKLVCSEENWGSRKVLRVVLQFRFEVRLGTRDREISLLFRETAPPHARMADRRHFEEVLSAAAGASA